MNFTVGQRRKTRNGCEVEILKTDAPGKFPIIGLVHLKCAGSSPKSWTRDGSLFLDQEHPLDLMPLTRDVWVKLYRRRAGGVQTGITTYASAAEARERPAPGLDFLGAFKIEGVPE